MQHRPDSALAVAIQKNKKDEVEKLLQENKKLETESDISMAFSHPKETALEVLELLDQYHALPQDISINTLKFVLRLYGNKSIELEDGKLINLDGCRGLKSPMDLFIKTGNLSGVQFLIEQGVQKRPLFDLFRRVYGLHPLFQVFGNYGPSGLVEDGITHLDHDLTKFKLKITRYKNSIEETSQIAELFLKYPTEQLDAEMKEIFKNKNDDYKFVLLPFFIWVGINNHVDLFNDKNYFCRLAEFYKDAFSEAMQYAALFKEANEFVKKSLNILPPSVLFLLINIAVATHNQELLLSIPSMILKEKPPSKNSFNNPMYLAIVHNNIEAADYLLKVGMDPNGYSDAIIEPSHLHYAVLENNLSFVKLFQAYNAKINIKDSSGRTPLHLACNNNDRLEIAKFLLKNNAIINSKDHFNSTPLHFACKKEQRDIAKLLIKTYPASINSVDNDCRTPLDYIKDKSIKQELLPLAKGIRPFSIFRETKGEEKPFSALDGWDQTRDLVLQQLREFHHTHPSESLLILMQHIQYFLDKNKYSFGNLKDLLKEEKKSDKISEEYKAVLDKCIDDVCNDKVILHIPRRGMGSWG